MHPPPQLRLVRPAIAQTPSVTTTNPVAPRHPAPRPGSLTWFSEDGQMPPLPPRRPPPPKKNKKKSKAKKAAPPPGPQPEPEPEPQPQPQPQLEFEAAAAFDGARAAFEFKRGDKGLGYYRSDPTLGAALAASKAEAAPHSLAEALRGGGLTWYTPPTVVGGFYHDRWSRHIICHSSTWWGWCTVLLICILVLIIRDHNEGCFLSGGCSEHGVCDGVVFQTCLCTGLLNNLSHYAGTLCNRVCLNNFTSDGGNGCACSGEYVGEFCELVGCSNDGVPQNGKCECLGHYYGVQCEKHNAAPPGVG